VTVTLRETPPAQIVAGDSLEYMQAIPADLSGWTPSARLTGPGSSATMSATSCTVSGSSVDVLFSGQSTPGTKTLTPGQYLLTVWMTNGNDRYTIAKYPITITTDLSTGTPAQTFAAAQLAVVETAIANRLSGNTDGGIDEYEILGRRVKKIPLKDLYALRTRLQAEVRLQQNPNGAYGRVKVKFTQEGMLPDLMRRYS